MKFANAIMRIMNRLGAIPGLSFLGGYVIAAKTTHTRFGQRKGDYEAYLNNVRRAGGDVKGIADGSEDGGGMVVGVPESKDEDRPVEYDYYEDYEDESGSYGAAPRSTDGGYDDYPASDDATSYFDDDYPQR